MDLAKPHMVKSTVVDSKTGQSKDSRSASIPLRLSHLHFKLNHTVQRKDLL